jgi:hypothetical protein
LTLLDVIQAVREEAANEEEAIRDLCAVAGAAA